jgi:pimeloyl-ACP methyl ester carboxylesterase
MAALSRTAKAIGSPPRDDSAGHDVSRRGQFKLPVPVHSTACGKGKREVQEPSARVGRATMSIGSSKPLPSHHSFVRPPRSHSSVPAALSKTPARAAPRQGWRVSATARLVLDGRESDGMLMRHGATQVANATPQSPRGHSHQTPFPCSPARRVVEILRQALLHARYHEIADAGHMSPLTHPAQVAEAIRRHVGAAYPQRRSAA